MLQGLFPHEFLPCDSILCHAVFMSYIPQQSFKAMSNSLSSSFQFLSFFPFSPTLTSASAIAVCLPLLGNIFNEQHWNLVNIVFMVAKLSKAKFVSGNQKCFFCFRQKHFCFCFRNICFLRG